ncbi:transmembrane protein 223 [Petromyzon marinus]|uniref:transmembrane protein 223 n=1 Tax=Petromyzon marinus TaxID=7757 RepID=UPI003F723163
MLLQAAAAAFICPSGATSGLGQAWRLGLACWGRPLLHHRLRPFNSWTRPLHQRARPFLQSPRPFHQRPRPVHQKPRPDVGPTYRGKNLEASLWRSVNLNVPRDVMIFERSDGRLPRLLALFACSQAVFWVYLAHFSFGALTSSSELWRYGFSMFCLTVGVMIMLGCVFFSSRYVQRVVLLRGGRALTFRTAAPRLGPLGPARAFEVAVDSVSCPIAVSSATAVLPVRVRGRRFYYLIDKHGSVPNRSLFDATLGTFRHF